MQAKDKTVWYLGALAVGVYLFVFGGLTQIGKVFTPTVEAAGNIGNEFGPTATTLADFYCPPNTLQTTAQVRYSNGINTTNADYLGPTVEIWYDSGARVNSVILTQNSAGYTTQTVNCPSKGEYFVLGNSTINSINSRFFAGDVPNHAATTSTDIIGSRASTAEIRLIDTLQNNISATETDSETFSNGNVNARTTAQAIAAGQTTTFLFDVRPITASTQVGDHIGGILLCTNASLGVYNTVIISGGKNLQSVAVPTSISGNQTKCWKDIGIRTDESWRSYKITTTAGTEPGTSDGYAVRVMDYQNFLLPDGKVSNDVRDRSNTDVGVADAASTVIVS